MNQTPLPLLAGAALLMATLAGLTGCGSDDTGDSERSSTSSSTTRTGDPGTGSDASAAADDAFEAVGEDGVLQIAAEQLVGKFGLTGFEIDGERLVMTSEQAEDQAEAQCLQAGLVLDGVGSTAPLSIKYPDATVKCEEFS